MCFDSVKSVNAVLQAFKLGPVQYGKLLCVQLSDKIQSCLIRQQQRNRRVSTFMVLDDLQHISNEQRDVLLVNMASDPIDIMWKNMGGTNRGLFIFRRLFLHVLTLTTIIFITTPTAMLSTLEQIDTFGFLSFEWAEKLPLGSFFKANMPPLVVLGIN